MPLVSTRRQTGVRGGRDDAQMTITAPTARADASFEELQKTLVPLWESIRTFGDENQTIVVVPSLTIDGVEAEEVKAYEERYLFLLLLLRQPRARLIYVTSERIDQSIIDYYLSLLPGVIPSQARSRLHLLATSDSSPRPLSEKILERPRFIEKIRELIPDPSKAHLVPYVTTELERDLSLKLGIPMYGADPRHFHFGTKTGCRILFREESVPHPVGEEDIGSIPEVVAAISRMRVARPRMAEVLVKLNEGASGNGNALVDLRHLPPQGSHEEAPAITERVRNMKFEKPDTIFDAYVAKLATRKGIVEERLSGGEIRSPSVQMRVTPLGDLEILSTHDQLLGGPSGQSYLGCRFPADDEYARAITIEAEKIGRRLAAEGVIGRFAVDFVVIRNGDQSWHPYAIEVNLRKGGTTHPFLTLQFLTDGSYDPEKAVFTTRLGNTKFFIASDHVESDSYRGLTPDDLFDIAVRHRLQFDQATQTGIVFHMMSALSVLGRVGLTAVADSHEAAAALYDRALAVLGEESRSSFDPIGSNAGSLTL